MTEFMTSMYKYYFETFADKVKQFGKKTVILMECGSFFEVYGTEYKGKYYGNAVEISDVLNIQKAKKVCSDFVYDMVGFPNHAVKRFIEILIKYGYTIIKIEQTSPPPNPKREITQIISPGTYIEDLDYKSNNLVSIYLEEVSGSYLVAFSMIDLSTGKSCIYEYGGDDITVICEELFRFIESNSVKEIILNTKNCGDLFIKDIESIIDGKDILYHLYCDKVKKEYFKLSYQNEFFKRVFKYDGLISPIEYLDLSMYPLGIISYIILLQFSYEHDLKIIDGVEKPTIWKESEHLLLTHDTLYQLDIIDFKQKYDDNTHIRSLFDVLNKCYTAMGKRLLKDRILNPIIDKEELESRYDNIDMMMKQDSTLIIEQLRNIVDIERLIRRLTLGRLAPNSFALNMDSFESCLNILNILKDTNCYSFDHKKIDHLTDFIEEYNNIFDREKMLNSNMVNMKESFFKKGVNKEIDDLQDKYDQQFKKINDIKDHLSSLLKDGDNVELKYTVTEGYYLRTTVIRSNILKKLVKDEYTFTVKRGKSNYCSIVSPTLSDINSNIRSYLEELSNLLYEKYIEKILEIANKYNSILSEISLIIAEVDLLISNIKCINSYGYCKPIISDLYDGKSYINVKEIRHPIIERVLTEYEYVTNDISLDHEKGLGTLLYGINGSGKSSMAKSVGCCIILAQMGMYVPAKEFSYYPFKTIFTRISGSDNIFKGYSSFAVEMNDLRGLIRYGNDRSLVLGDEVCKGTEYISAVSIVASSLMHFVEKGVKFVFATHLHQIPKLDCIKDLGSYINVRHLSVSIEDNRIIYGRKLKEGQGESVYGLEVAKYIINNDKFISNAEKIRRGLMGEKEEVLSTKTSKYNSNLYVDVCQICGVKENLDVHHIKEQASCNKYGLYDHIDKNILANLVVLCKKDHNDVHNGVLRVNGYLETTNGRKLKWEKVTEKRKRQKYGEKDLIVFNKYKKMVNTVPMKYILECLRKEGYKISAQTLKKYWK
jgi:DNA mismatch repair protein MutS